MDEIVYLGQLISLKNRTEKELNRRISLGWGKFWQLKEIFKGPFNINSKIDIFNSCIIPTLAYGTQTWPLTQKILKKLEITQNKMQRSLLNLKLKDRVKNKIIKQKVKGITDIIYFIKKQKWKWVGHVNRLRDERWTYKLTVWNPYKKRKPGRQRGQDGSTM